MYRKLIRFLFPRKSLYKDPDFLCLVESLENTIIMFNVEHNELKKELRKEIQEIKNRLDEKGNFYSS